MPVGYDIDLDALHRILRRRADRLGRLKIRNLRELADDLGLGYCHLSTILGKFAKEGRLKVLAGSKQGRKTYYVRDPETWRDEL